MNRLSLFGLLALLLTFASCKEQEDAGAFDNWQQRNDLFIDSIAQVCRTNADGRWAAYRAFNLGISSTEDSNTQHYVYVHRLTDGDGDYNPLYTDSVRVHYSGRLIPNSTYSQGYIFNKSYYGTVLDETIDVPALMGVSGTISGFSTALMHMVQGDTWRIYVPYYLGYGATEQSSAKIPAYSTLIFDIKLARIYRYKIDTNTGWW